MKRISEMRIAYSGIRRADHQEQRLMRLTVRDMLGQAKAIDWFTTPVLSLFQRCQSWLRYRTQSWAGDSMLYGT